MFLESLAISFFLGLQAQAADLSLQETLNSPAFPLKITTQLKSNATVTQLISASQGGQIALKSASGTQYILTFPAHSLPFDQYISLTEIESFKLNSDGFNSEIRGVQIHPDGVELIAPAVLEIRTLKPFNRDSFSILTSKNDGSATHIPTLKTFSENAIAFSLTHFSNYLASEESQIQDIVDKGQPDLQSIRIWNWLNKKIQKIAESKDQNQTEQLRQQYLDSLKEFANTLLIPQMAHADTCEKGQAALTDYLVLSRQATVVGIDLKEVLGVTASDAFETARNLTKSLCIQEARAYCHAQHRIVPALQIYLKVGRIAAMLGDDSFLTEIESAANKCMTFKYFSQSDFWMGEDRKESHGVQTISEFDFSFTLNGVVMAGAGFLNANGTIDPVHDFQSGQIDVADAYMRMDPMTCRRDSLSSTPGEMKVDNFVADLLVGRPAKLRIDGMNPQFKAQFTCWESNAPDDSFTLELPPYGAENYFQGLFHSAHGPTGLNEMDKEGYWVLKNAVFRDSEKFAEAVYNHVVEDVIHETTTVIIFHTPQD